MRTEYQCQSCGLRLRHANAWSYRSMVHIYVQYDSIHWWRHHARHPFAVLHVSLKTVFLYFFMNKQFCMEFANLYVIKFTTCIIFKVNLIKKSVLCYQESINFNDVLARLLYNNSSIGKHKLRKEQFNDICFQKCCFHRYIKIK